MDFKGEKVHSWVRKGTSRWEILTLFTLDLIFGLAISTDDKNIVSVSKDQSIKIWNWQSQSLVYTFEKAHDGKIKSCEMMS
jgi:WD40 repeat protein